MYATDTAIAATQTDDISIQLDDAIERSHATFLRQQHREGFWHAPLEANVSMDAQYIFLNRFMGRQMTRSTSASSTTCWRRRRTTAAGRSTAAGPAISATPSRRTSRSSSPACPPTTPALRRAREFILEHGGLARAGVFTRTFLAYFGQFPWAGLPAMPVELVLLPPWFPINIYAMSSWARETVVPLTVLMAKQPHVRDRARRGVDELWLRPPTRARSRLPAQPPSSSPGATPSSRSTPR